MINLKKIAEIENLYRVEKRLKIFIVLRKDFMINFKKIGKIENFYCVERRFYDKQIKKPSITYEEIL